MVKQGRKEEKSLLLSVEHVNHCGKYSPVCKSVQCATEFTEARLFRGDKIINLSSEMSSSRLCSKICQWFIVLTSLWSTQQKKDFKTHSNRHSLGCNVSVYFSSSFQRTEKEEDKIRLEEKEKTCLSLLEEKLRDALTLLLQLRNKVPFYTIHLTYKCTIVQSSFYSIH